MKMSKKEAAELIRTTSSALESIGACTHGVRYAVSLDPVRERPWLAWKRANDENLVRWLIMQTWPFLTARGPAPVTRHALLRPTRRIDVQYGAIDELARVGTVDVCKFGATYHTMGPAARTVREGLLTKWPSTEYGYFAARRSMLHDLDAALTIDAFKEIPWQELRDAMIRRLVDRGAE